MPKVTYHIVEHDGGWPYQVDGAYSETYPTHHAARAAARRAAGEQRISGEEEAVSYEDAAGQRHEELVQGADWPDTDVTDG